MPGSRLTLPPHGEPVRVGSAGPTGRQEEALDGGGGGEGVLPGQESREPVPSEAGHQVLQSQVQVSGSLLTGREPRQEPLTVSTFITSF